MAKIDLKLENISVQDLAILQNEAMREGLTIEQFILKAVSEYLKIKYEPKEEGKKSMDEQEKS